MKSLFTLSFALLWGLVVLEAVVLRDVLRKTVRFKRILADINHNSKVEEISWLRTGTPVPDFTAPLLGTGEFLSTRQLRGQPSILLFVSPEESSPHYEKLAIAIHGMWHKAQGRLYLVCNGTAEACRQLARDHSVEEFTEDQIPVVLDDGGAITERFLISSTPQAVELDEYLRVKRYGRPGESKRFAEDEGSNGDGPLHTDDGNPPVVTGTDSEPWKERMG